MKKKTKYRVRNWKQYTQSLKKRGSLTVWINREAIANWYNKELTGEPGASPIYSDIAIETMAVVQAIYGLPGRQTQGFIESIFELMKIKLSVPDHTTLSRRRGHLSVKLPVKRTSKPLHIVIDSTGMKVYGEGEWKVRQHGPGKRRTWYKLNLCVDESTGEILNAVACTNSFTDAQVFEDLLLGVDGVIEQVSADSAYDKRHCYDTLNQLKAKAAIPPQRNAKLWQHGNSKAQRHIRDENVRRIRKVGRRQWKIESNYHRRSLAETAMFRFKTIFGDKVNTRKIDNQFNELLLKTAILNRITHLGMPLSYKVTG